jgi:hypothetical protein
MNMEILELFALKGHGFSRAGQHFQSIARL